MISVVVPELKMNMSQAGAYMSAFYIGYVITQVPGGVLADRFGVSLILAGSLIISGLTTFGMGFITDFDTGFWLRIATGLGGGAVISCCARALMEWFPAKERGTAFGLLFMAPSVGVVLSNYVVPALNAILQWRGTFQAIGIATTLLGILIYFLVKTSDQAKGEKKALLGGFKVIFSSRDLILVCLAGFCLMWVQIGTMTWANAFIKRLGFSLQDAGYVMIWYGIGGVIAPAVSGYISDKMGNRKALLLGSYIVTIPLTVIFGYMTTMPMLMLLAFIFGFCSFVANPHLNLLVSEYAGKEWAATANGTAGFVYQLAPIIGSVILGWSIDITGNFNIVWWLMAVGPLVGTLLLLPIRVPKSI
jgi:sugar phosphate permease